MFGAGESFPARTAGVVALLVESETSMPAKGFDPWGRQIFPQPELRLHLKEPDYQRPLLQLTAEQKQVILEQLTVLYGKQRAETCFPEMERVMRVHYAHRTPEMIEGDRHFNPANRFTERDLVVITYGGFLRGTARHPLQILHDMLLLFLSGVVNTVHLLPFFPYSSDRGFSVVDYREVDPSLGTWDDIERLSLRFRLMFDGVINHVSSKSEWFQQFLNGNPDYQDFFTCFSTKDEISEDHLRLILRPRTTELLSPFQTINGPKHVWTTFSRDQIDLNYRNERVLLRILDILLSYVRKGSNIIRMDAATYLWCELGTSCSHLVGTHALIKLFRAVLDVVAPKAAILTETNVPHADNVSYFGNGHDEAHMVYNFALPPLVLHTFHTGNSRKLSQWAAELTTPSDQTTFFNFLDSHDGVGLLGARGVLSFEEIDELVRKTTEHGGLVSYRTSSDGSPSPYELNIPWFDALNRFDAGEDDDLQVSRVIASRAVSLVLKGVPAIYIAMFSARDILPVKASDLDEPRSINRRPMDEQGFFASMSDSTSLSYKIMLRFGELAEQRVGCPAFHPNGPQQVLMLNESVFTVVRQAPDSSALVLTLTNVTGRKQEVAIPESDLPRKSPAWQDIIGGGSTQPEKGFLRCTLEPYQVAWLAPQQ